jgi:hypothetical protein
MQRKILELLRQIDRIFVEGKSRVFELLVGILGTFLKGTELRLSLTEGMDLVHDMLKRHIGNRSCYDGIANWLLVISPYDGPLDLFSHLKNVRSFLRIEKAEGDSAPSGSGSSSAPVDEGLQGGWEVVVDNVADVGDINTSGTEIRHDQKLVLFGPEVLQVVTSLLLVHFGVQKAGLFSDHFVQHQLEEIHLVFGGYEDDGLFVSWDFVSNQFDQKGWFELCSGFEGMELQILTELELGGQSDQRVLPHSNDRKLLKRLGNRG